MTDVLDDMCHMLYDAGDNCDIGWFGPVDKDLSQKAIDIGKKPCCFVKDWTIWDLNFEDDQLKTIEESSCKPTVIYSRHVIEDQLYRFRPGDQMRSSLLKAFHDPAFFETSNTMYVLIGKYEVLIGASSIDIRLKDKLRQIKKNLETV